MRKPKGLWGLNTIFAWSKSAVDGRISIGGVAEDNVRHAVLLENNYDPRHYLALESSDRRISMTTLESPAGITVKTGQDNSRYDGTFCIQVENGNLVIDVQNGDLDVKARNINLRSEYGTKGGTGNVTMFANNAIDMQSSIMRVTAKQTIDITSNNLLRLMGDQKTEFITGISMMSSYSSRRGTQPEILPEGELMPGNISKPQEDPA